MRMPLPAVADPTTHPSPTHLPSPFVRAAPPLPGHTCTRCNRRPACRGQVSSPPRRTRRLQSGPRRSHAKTAPAPPRQRAHEPQSRLRATRATTARTHHGGGTVEGAPARRLLGRHRRGRAWPVCAPRALGRRHPRAGRAALCPLRSSSMLGEREFVPGGVR